MKIRYQSLLTAVILSAGLHAAAQTKPMATIRGKVDKEKVAKVYLFHVAQGEMTEYATTRLDAGRNYAFALPDAKEGFYYVSDNNSRRSLPTRFYLKPGENVTVDIHATSTDITGTSPENKLLGQWEKMYSELAVPSFRFFEGNYDYKSFFPALEAFIPKAEAFKKQINTPNKSFNSLLRMVVDSDVEYAAIYFIYTPRSIHPTREQYPAYYNSIIQMEKFCDTRILQLGDAIDRMERYTMFYNMNSGVKIAAGEHMQHAVSAICNDTLKGLFLTAGVDRYKSLEKLRTDYAPFMKYLLTDSAKAKYLRQESAIASYAKGEKAYNFAYPDINGDTVSLASLKGKVVLVDTWATWCMPCRAEIPHLQKLEEELRGKSIAFVSLSVDEAKDKNKWVEFVKKEKLGGIQLYAKGFSEFAHYYKINSIPRFLVFDKAGNIVTVDAPRPSQPELKALLLQLSEG